MAQTVPVIDKDGASDNVSAQSWSRPLPTVVDPPEDLAAAEVDPFERPQLAPNIQLSGRLQDSGFQDQQWLIQRDGRFIQLSELLYRVIEQVDGTRTLDEIAARVTDATVWLIRRDQVRYLLETKLAPMGIIAAGTEVIAPARPDPNSVLLRSPLHINLRLRMISPRVIEPISRVLQVLFAPAVLVPVLVIAALAHGWLYLELGVGNVLRTVLFTPGYLPLAILLAFFAGAIHEFGHAAALRYGGGRVRWMGAGLYLMGPVFYTDVTDSYRLDRRARVRTGLGGVYFDLIFSLSLLGAYALTGHEFLILVVVLVNIEIIVQFLPFFRLDGYWVLADLAGIPDFFSQLRPFLRSVAPRLGKQGQALPRLKPWARAVFAGYILFTVPVLTFLLYLTVTRAPRFLATAWEASETLGRALPAFYRTGETLLFVGAVSQLFVLTMAVVGTSYLLFILGWQLAVMVWRWTAPRRSRRLTGLGLSTLSIVALLTAFGYGPLAMSGGEIAGVERIPVTSREHVDGPVTYAQVPPIGGDHSPIWQNCGFYDAPVVDEHAVHSLEHGAVWITYRPDLDAAEVALLRKLAQDGSHVLVSPYSGLPDPVVASAWGRQLRLDTAHDPRLGTFVETYQNGLQAPEPDGPCHGGVGGLPD